MTATQRIQPHRSVERAEDPFPLAPIARCAVIGPIGCLTMTRESVSFRITRNTEDLAQTIHTLSQRVVKLEQRLAAMELLLDRRADPDPSEVSSLDNVERLLEDCRQLLDLSPVDDASGESELADGDRWVEAA